MPNPGADDTIVHTADQRCINKLRDFSGLDIFLFFATLCMFMVGAIIHVKNNCDDKSPQNPATGKDCNTPNLFSLICFILASISALLCCGRICRPQHCLSSTLTLMFLQRPRRLPLKSKPSTPG